MSDIFCRKYQKELPALDKAPFPGDEGQEILATVSKQAWQAWLKHQTLLINEKRLALFDPETKVFLAEQRALFLQPDGEESLAKIDGYAPVQK